MQLSIAGDRVEASAEGGAGAGRGLVHTGGGQEEISEGRISTVNRLVSGLHCSGPGECSSCWNEGQEQGLPDEFKAGYGNAIRKK